MPTISIVTAALVRTEGDGNRLREAAESVLAQSLPAGWAWEWLVQEDGPSNMAEARLPADPRIIYGHNRQSYGPGVTRNLALSRARGEIIRNLDADDILLPEGLATSISLLTAYPDAAWCVGERLEFDDQPAEGFEARPGPNSVLLSEGIVPVGEIARLLNETDRFQVHCAGLAARTAPLRALGGWAGLPRSEDTVLLGALSELFPGVYTATPTFRYRRRAGQLSSQPWSVDMVPQARAIFWQRVQAVRDLHQSQLLGHAS